jgi:hypothetical protein
MLVLPDFFVCDVIFVQAAGFASGAGPGAPAYPTGRPNATLARKTVNGAFCFF